MPSNTSPRRLTEKDAAAIFSSLANNEKPPEGLEFKIIRVPSNGLKLSPPSLEFENGLYALIRSPSGKPACVPSELSDKLMTEDDLSGMQSCPWSLSGPQYPKRTQIQQRYCYPRGNAAYSHGKGGSIWTRLYEGTEDIDCRILHVYHSSKRAGTVVKPTKVVSQEVKSKGVPLRQPKRKTIGPGQLNKKKKKIDLEQINVDYSGEKEKLYCPSLLQGDLLKSPSYELKSPSYELDSSLSFNCDNLFSTDIQGMGSFDSFSFMPVNSKDIDDLLKNNPAFNSAAKPSQEVRPKGMAPHTKQQHAPARPATNVGHYAYRHCADYARHPPYGYYGDWMRAAPPIPHLTSSEDKKNDGKGKSILDLKDFSKRLRDIEESTMADIRGSTGPDQALKLHLLQNWAKVIAQKPRQPRHAPSLAPTESNISAKLEKIKMESQGKPSITP